MQATAILVWPRTCPFDENVFHILVADDSATDVFVFQEALKSFVRPCQVDWVRDGSAAFDFLYRRGIHANALRPDLILLDMNMPGVSGLDVLRTIKSDPDLRTIPVIMLSSSTSPAYVRMSYLAHANSYLQKPTSLQNLTRLVRAIEAFWIDVAVLPSKNEEAALSSFSERGIAVTACGAGVSHSGPENTFQMPEATSPAIGSDESVASRFVSVAGNAGCNEHRHFLDEFGEAVHELLRLHDEQFLAIVRGDGDSSRFDLLIHMANETKQLAKYAYIRHVESHGCANFDAINKTRTGSDYG